MASCAGTPEGVRTIRVEPGADDRSLIEVSGQGRRVIVGRYLRPELRPALAQEIRRALRDGA